MSDIVKSEGKAEVIPKDTAAAEHTRSLQALASAAGPLFQQYLDGTRAMAQDKYKHSERMAEVEERMEDKLHRRLFPLAWFGASAGVAVVLWACYAGLWQVATHILTAVVAGFAGWAARPQFESVALESEE